MRYLFVALILTRCANAQDESAVVNPPAQVLSQQNETIRRIDVLEQMVEDNNRILLEIQTEGRTRDAARLRPLAPENPSEALSKSLEAARTKNRSRTLSDRLSTGTAITTPLRVPQAYRHHDTGAPYRPLDLFPGPNDPNDNQNHVANSTTSLTSFELVPFGKRPGDALRILYSNADATPSDDEVANAVSAAQSTKNTTMDLGFQIRPGILYDSGYAGGSAPLNPGTIALDGSTLSHKNGQTVFLNNKPDDFGQLTLPVTRLQAGLNQRELFGFGSAAEHVDLVSLDGQDFSLRTAAVRYLNTTEELGFGFGKIETLFGDLASSPSSLLTGSLPTGTVSAGSVVTDKDKKLTGFTGVTQFRISRYWHNAIADQDLLEVAFSLEDPSLGSKSIDVDGLVNKPSFLARYPTMVGRLRYGTSGFDTYQIAGMVLPTGFEYTKDNSSFHENFAVGYGMSANARFELSEYGLNDTVYCGAVWGRGIGQYIFGNLPGGYVIDSPDVTVKLVESTGAYASYRHVWAVDCDGSAWSSNLMGGLAQAGRTETNQAGKNRQLYQAGANLVWDNGHNTTVGIEYQFASREASRLLAADNFAHHGENHRVMFVLQFAPLPASVANSEKQGQRVQASTRMAAPSQELESAEQTPSGSKKSRLRY